MEIRSSFIFVLLCLVRDPCIAKFLLDFINIFNSYKIEDVPHVSLRSVIALLFPIFNCQNKAQDFLTKHK